MLKGFARTAPFQSENFPDSDAPLVQAFEYCQTRLVGGVNDIVRAWL